MLDDRQKKIMLWVLVGAFFAVIVAVWWFLLPYQLQPNAFKGVQKTFVGEKK